MKKILSLALALILTLSAFVLPASAAENNTDWCPDCGTTAVITRGCSKEMSSFTVSSCEIVDGYHPHFVMKYYSICDCLHCGTFEFDVYYDYDVCLNG